MLRDNTRDSSLSHLLFIGMKSRLINVHHSFAMSGVLDAELGRSLSARRIILVHLEGFGDGHMELFRHSSRNHFEFTEE